MLGRHEQRLTRALLDDLPTLEHQNTIGHSEDGGQVVGDENHSHSTLDLQVLEQLQHLGLFARIEHRHRLVGDQELGLEDEGSGEGDPLQLTARQLVRLPVQKVVVGSKASSRTLALLVAAAWDPARLTRLRDVRAEAQAAGVYGVPSLTVRGRLAFFGAPPPGVVGDALRRHRDDPDALRDALGTL